MIPIPHKAQRLIRIEVEYDCGDGRTSKPFTDLYEARRFYVAKDKAGKHPHIRSSSAKETTMATTTKKAATKKSATKAKAAATKKATKDTATASGPAGVRPAMNRSYCAALVIKKHGLKAGVTEDMVKEVEALYGKPAPAGGIGWLTAAWHAINAWTGELPVESEE
jgi:hypothetical protein